MLKASLKYSFVLLLSASLVGSILPGFANAKILGAWLFEEGKGDQAKDSSGRSVDGVLVGNPEWVAGKFGTALKFEPNKYVDFPPPLSEKMIIEKDFTCMAWMKPHKWEGSWNGVFSMQAGSTNGEIYGIYFGSGGGTEIYCWTRINGQAKGATTGKGAVNLDEWVHGAITYDGSKMIVYKNGEKAAETAISGNVDNADRKGRFVINGNYNSLDGGLSEWCSATVDEVLVFDEALLQDKIKLYMEKGFAGNTSVEPSDRVATTWGELKVSR